MGDIMCVSSKPSASAAPQAPEEGTRAEEQRHTCLPCIKVNLLAIFSLSSSRCTTIAGDWLVQHCGMLTKGRLRHCSVHRVVLPANCCQPELLWLIVEAEPLCVGQGGRCSAEQSGGRGRRCASDPGAALSNCGGRRSPAPPLQPAGRQRGRPVSAGACLPEAGLVQEEKAWQPGPRVAKGSWGGSTGCAERGPKPTT